MFGKKRLKNKFFCIPLDRALNIDGPPKKTGNGNWDLLARN
jgi:hypothetical protein